MVFGSFWTLTIGCLIQILRPTLQVHARSVIHFEVCFTFQPAVYDSRAGWSLPQKPNVVDELTLEEVGESSRLPEELYGALGRTFLRTLKNARFSSRCSAGPQREFWEERSTGY